MIYDYNETQRILDSFQNSIIKEEKPLEYTKLAKLPIRHFTLGKGLNHIVVTGCQHSNEIITTTFVLELMKYLTNNNIIFENLTIHFIPILNPEGYLINTSAIRNKIKSTENEDKIIKFCYEFYKKYKIDNLISKTKTKLHQQIFEDTNHLCINNDYQILRDSVEEILSYHPKGSIINWASNGNGIDLNSNSIHKQVSPFEYNKQNVYNNIRMDIPSPIGHPGKNNQDDFQQEIEALALKNLLETLNKEHNLLGYLNYHSVGGLIYQRPKCNDIFFLTYNYLLSKYYQEHTIKNNSKYVIIERTQDKITSVNDKLRIDYPGNLLIELSPMMGNPIGPFGDITNYYKTIDCNIKSFIYTMSNIENAYNTSKEITTEITSQEEIYDYVDKIYDTKKKILAK